MSQIISGATDLIPTDYKVAALAGGGALSNKLALTAADINNLPFLGITVDGWMAIGGALAVAVGLVYGILRLGRAIYNLFKGRGVNS